MRSGNNRPSPVSVVASENKRPAKSLLIIDRNSKNKQQICETFKLLAPLPIVWPSEADCNTALSNFTTYHLSDSLGLLDALIATCAVSRNATLYTFNLKHYRVVPNLILAHRD